MKKICLFTCLIFLLLPLASCTSRSNGVKNSDTVKGNEIIVDTINDSQSNEQNEAALNTSPIQSVIEQSMVTDPAELRQYRTKGAA